MQAEDVVSRFPWPPVPGSKSAPRWTGAGFEVDGAPAPWLTYVVERSGWSDELTAMHEVEAGDDHPIDIASRERAVTELARHWSGDGVVMDVGCSSGWMLRDLRRAFPRALVIGADYVSGPLRRIAREDAGQPLMQFDLTRAPLPDGSLDAIVALNVLEHIEDDRAAVEQMHRMLRPGGVAIIELPAGPRLYDVFDKALLHHRRYTRAGAEALFEQAGFRVERTTHIGFFVYPAFVAAKLRNRRFLRKSEAEQQAIAAKLIRRTKASRVMGWLMRAETSVGKAVPYPVGVRVAFTGIRR
jgi:SAM-dependent methyltransferase